MNVNPANLVNLTVGASRTFGYDRFSVLGKRVDDTTWTFTILTSDMKESEHMAQVFSRNGGRTFVSHVDHDGGDSFTSDAEHHSPRSAIVDALIILVIG